jgi:5'-deoxynucleotidase YfbR-like HD superfamily hydrolase
MIANRAWVLLPSGRRLDLLNPDPLAWTDHDLAVGLSRTYRWAGYSAWDLPLSVAQHSLTVLAIRQGSPGPDLTPPEALRELLHDAEEALLGGWDPITPLKPHLGPGFDALVQRLQAAVAERYRLPAWTAASYALHKHADRLAAASEAFHVAGWSRQAMRESLGITLEPLADDPLPIREGMRAWEPWPPNLAAHLFLTRMNELQTASSRGSVAKGWCHALRR